MLFVDGNVLLHAAMSTDHVLYAQDKPAEYARFVVEYISSMVCMVALDGAPFIRERVHVRFDGCAPVAKMNEQRARRLVSGCSRDHITVGTVFMREVALAVRTQGGAMFPGLAFTVEGCDTPGEGEQGIMQHVKGVKQLRPDVNVAVFSCDFDIVSMMEACGLQGLFVIYPEVEEQPNDVYKGTCMSRTVQ